METKTPYPPDYLAKAELLPDGTVTVNPQTWIQSWADYTRSQVQKGCIKLHEVPEYDADTGAVPNSFIHTIYLKTRKLN